jgi:hypothetical protein
VGGYISSVHLLGRQLVKLDLMENLNNPY